MRAGLSSFITGLSGQRMSDGEKRFVADARPCGLILFKRNCHTPGQIRALISDFMNAVGDDELIIAIDQEGGRVQRLGPPQWRTLPSARAYGCLWRRDRVSAPARTRLVMHLLAGELRALGINTNMLPLLDLPQPDAHAIISDRAFGSEVAQIIELGQAVADGLRAGGVRPVMKHIPGHGRAVVDSHEALPVVDAALEELKDQDFAPFRALKDLRAAMTAHVVFSAIDPHQPASISRKVHDEVIRGHIGFDGLLMSDDLSMKALSGTMGERTAAVFAAGSDIALHCNGHLKEMEAVAGDVPPLEGESLLRFRKFMNDCRLSDSQPVDICAAEAVIAECLSLTS